MKKVVLFAVSILFFFNLSSEYSVKKIDEQVVRVSRDKIERAILINKILKNSLLIAPATILAGTLFYTHVLNRDSSASVDIKKELENLKLENLAIRSHLKMQESSEVNKPNCSDQDKQEDKAGFLNSVGGFIQSKIDFTINSIKKSIPVIGTLALQEFLFGGFVGKVSSVVGSIFEDRNVYWMARKNSIYKTLDSLKYYAQTLDPDTEGFKMDINNSLSRFISGIDEVESAKFSLEAFSHNLAESVKLVSVDQRLLLQDNEIPNYLTCIESSCNKLVTSLEQLVAYMEIKALKIEDESARNQAFQYVKIVKNASDNFAEFMQTALNSDYKIFSQVVVFREFIINIIDSFYGLEE